MAHPIYTFIYPKNQQRYYQVWDTYTGYPETIPMDLLTLLQFKGTYNKAYVGTVFSVFNQLLKQGTSLVNSVFPEPNAPNDPFYLQAVLFLEEFEYQAHPGRISLNRQLEALFSDDIEFSEFYSQYESIVSLIDEHPPCQMNFYLSYAHTASCLSKSGSLTHLIVKQVFDAYNLSHLFAENKSSLFDFDAWFKAGLFFTQQEAMSTLFVRLGVNNLVAIDAIPHVLRKYDAIKALFKDFRMQALLPNTRGSDNHIARSFKYKKYKTALFLKAYVNHAAFHQLGDESLIGIPILKLSQKAILEKIRAVYLEPNGFLINFEDDYGQVLWPMQYSTYFKTQKQHAFVTLAPFGIQQYHVFLQNGRMVDDTGYYDVNMLSNDVAYFQHSDLQSWQRLAFDSAQKICYSEEVKINLDYENEELGALFYQAESMFVQQMVLESHDELNERYRKREPQEEIYNNNNAEDDLPF